MVELILRAEPRTLVGKKVKQLRRAGRLPGVVYGPLLTQPTSVTVDMRELARFYQSFGASTLFRLTWEGGEEQVFIREVQVDPVKHTPVHVDFFAPNLRKDVTASVPLAFSEENEAATGILSVVLSEIAVTGLPSRIPSQIDVDITGLAEIGDAIRIADLDLPTGITTDLHEDEVVAHRVAEAAPEPEPSLEIEAEAEAADTSEEGEAETVVEVDES